MASSITGALSVLSTITHTGASDTSTLVDSLSGQLQAWTITSGTGADQADSIWHDQRTLALSTSENIDLAGTLTDAFGVAAVFARIKAVIVVGASTNGGLIQVGGAAANGFVNWVASSTDIVQVRAGGAFAIIAPDATAYAVTAGTADILKINNTDGAAAGTYDIYIIGASA